MGAMLRWLPTSRTVHYRIGSGLLELVTTLPALPVVAPFVSMRACLCHVCAKLKGPTSPKARSGRGMGVAFWTMAPLLSLFVSGAAAFRFPLHPPAAHQLLGNPMCSVAV